jgi:hypothetical protein
MAQHIYSNLWNFLFLLGETLLLVLSQSLVCGILLALDRQSYITLTFISHKIAQKVGSLLGPILVIIGRNCERAALFEIDICLKTVREL